MGERERERELGAASRFESRDAPISFDSGFFRRCASSTTKQRQCVRARSGSSGAAGKLIISYVVTRTLNLWTRLSPPSSNHHSCSKTFWRASFGPWYTITLKSVHACSEVGYHEMWGCVTWPCVRSRGPRLEFALPVGQRRQRRDDEEWPPQPLRGMEVVEERHRLHRLAEPHLVGEDRILFEVPVER